MLRKRPSASRLASSLARAARRRTRRLLARVATSSIATWLAAPSSAHRGSARLRPTISVRGSFPPRDPSLLAACRSARGPATRRLRLLSRAAVRAFWTTRPCGCGTSARACQPRAATSCPLGCRAPATRPQARSRRRLARSRPSPCRRASSRWGIRWARVRLAGWRRKRRRRQGRLHGRLRRPPHSSLAYFTRRGRAVSCSRGRWDGASDGL